MEKSLTNHAVTTQKRWSWHITLMVLSMFMTGASGMVVEYVLSTISTYLNGSQIEAFSLTLAIMLGMMGVGGYAQKFFSDENIIEKFVYLEVILAITSGFAPILIYAAFSYAPEHFQLVYYTLAMLIGFMVGFEIPFITRANAKYTKKLRDNLSFVFAADYIGAFVGALAFVYILLPFMDIIRIGYVLAALNFLVAIITYCYFKKGQLLTKGKQALILMTVAAGLLAYGYANVLDWSKLLEQKMYDDPIVESKKTAYQQLTITRNPKTKDTRLYINGNTQFSSLDEKRYHEMLVHVPIGMLPSTPEHVLLLGGGDGLAVRELRQYDRVRVDMVELDKEMFHWSKEQPNLVELNKQAFSDFEEYDFSDYQSVRHALRNFEASDQNRVFFTDASNFVNAFVQHRNDPIYDLIIIDLPDPYSLSINKMYTKEFYKRIQALLTDEGVMVTQATSPYHAPSVYSMIGRTLEDSGFKTKPYWHNIPSFGEWGWWAASRQPISFDGVKADTEYLTNPLVEGSFHFGKNTLIKEGDVNSLMRPRLVRLYNKHSWMVE